jgi:hypothetical protein
MILLAHIATPFSFDAGAGLHWCCAVSLYVAAGNTNNLRLRVPTTYTLANVCSTVWT